MSRNVTIGLVFCLFSSALITPVSGQVDPVGQILMPGVNNFRWVAEKDGYVYVTSRAGDFAVYDIRSLEANGPFKTIDSPIRQELDAGYLGLLRNANHLYQFGNGIRVLDITNPAAPVAGTSVTSPGTIYNMVQDHGYLFATGQNFLAVFSISAPASPTLVGSTNLGGRWGLSVARVGQYIHVGEFSDTFQGIQVFSWPSESSFESVYEVACKVPYNLLIRGGYLASCSDDGIRIWSLADQSRPAFIETYQFGGRAALTWGDLLVTSGRVFKWHGSMLGQTSGFPGVSQIDGFPFGTAASADFIFMAGSDHVAILTTPPTMVFPQYANGLTGDTKNRTRLVLRNRGTGIAKGAVQFRDSAGQLRSLPIGGASTSQVNYSIIGGGTLQIVTDGTGPLTLGSVEVRSDAIGDNDIQGTEIFDLLGYGVSVQKAPFATLHTAFASRTTGENTGVAMYNPSLTSKSKIQVRLLDASGGQVASPVTVELMPRQQRAIFIDDAALFQGYLSGLGGPFEGTLHLTVTEGAPISVVSLIQKSNGSLLAVPVESETLGP